MDSEIPEAPRTSLLDVIIEEYAQMKDKRTSRLILAAGFERSSHAEETQKFFEDFTNKHQGEHIIGGLCLIINEKAFIQCIEASTKLLLVLLRELNRDMLHLVRPKVVSFSEEVPREYKVWVCRNIDMPSDEYNTPKDWQADIFATMKHFLELGRELATMNDTKAVEYLETSLSRNFTQRVPTVEKIEAYGGCEDLCSIKEWLHIFDSPVSFTLENERVWPVEPSLTY